MAEVPLFVSATTDLGGSEMVLEVQSITDLQLAGFLDIDIEYTKGQNMVVSAKAPPGFTRQQLDSDINVIKYQAPKFVNRDINQKEITDGNVMQGGFIVKNVEEFRQRADIANVQPISTNTDGTVWVTATFLGNVFIGDSNVVHSEIAKPIGRQKRNAANFF